MSAPSTRRGVTIREVMTSHVRTARPDQSLLDVWRLLTDEDENLAGIVTNRDLLHYLAN